MVLVLLSRNCCVTSMASQLYKIKVPEEEIGRPFIDVLLRMKQNRQSIVVGVQQGEEGLVISNPDANYLLQVNDFLIVIAADSKSLSE